MSLKALECIDNHIAKFASHCDKLQAIKKLYNERLWFELTSKVIEYTSIVNIEQPGEVLIDFYERFLKDLEAKINYLKYAKMVVLVSRKFPDRMEANAFLDKIKARVGINKDAQMLLIIEACANLLRANKMIEAGDALAQAKALVDELSSADSLIYSEFYKSYATFFYIRQEHESFYQYALQYLAYTPETSLSTEEKVDWSMKMGMAILLGRKIYNIGELVEKDILKSLTTTKYVWLYDLLQAFNGGRIREYYAAVKHYEKQISEVAELRNNKDEMDTKIRILALLELIFVKQKEERSIPFDAIAQASDIERKYVEILVMKAMSLGLIKGEIDQIDGIVKITWMKPRVLDMQRLQILKDSLEKVKLKAAENLKKLEEKTKDLIGQN